MALAALFVHRQDWFYLPLLQWVRRFQIDRAPFQHLLDGLGIDQLASLHKIHRATAARWLTRVREELARRTRALLAMLKAQDARTVATSAAGGKAPPPPPEPPAPGTATASPIAACSMR